MADWSDASALACRRIGEVLLVAYLAARALFPSEDAASGSGLDFLPLAYGCGLCLALERMLDVRGPAFGAFGAAWIALLAAWCLSALRASYRFPAEIMALEWVGVAAVCLYARHRYATDGPGKMASLAVAILLTQSFVSAYQVFVEYPERRERYAAGERGFVEGMRQIGVEPGSRLETAFRNRLEANEPSGTTGHPNSLGGLCLLCLPLAALLAWNSRSLRGARRVATALAMAILLAGTATFIATKSRSAWLGAMASLVAVVIMHRRNIGWRRIGSWIAASAVVVAVVATALTLAGLLDVLVVTEAFKSLSYRWEWWQASVDVIAESPWLGVGAGSFGDDYLKHKLPFSSEEISDPHNVLIELWATGGLAALLAYLAVLAMGFRNLLAARRPSYPIPAGLGIDAPWWLGMALGLLVVLAFEIGPLTAIVVPENNVKLLCFLAAVLVLMGLQWSGLDWSQPAIRSCVLAGVVGLHVHWLAAGGVSFPGLTALAFAMLASSMQEPNDPRPVPLWRSLATVTAMLALIVWFFWAWWLPNFHRDLLQQRIRTNERKIEEILGAPARHPLPLTARAVPRRLAGLYDDWVEACENYAEIQAGDWEGWARLGLARTRQAEFLTIQDPAKSATAFDAAVDAWIVAMTLAPRRPEAYWQLGHLYLQQYSLASDPRVRASALRSLEKAIELHPRSASRRWQMGRLYEGLDLSDEAAREYREALWLDQTPHLDRKLTDQERRYAKTYLERRNSDEVDAGPKRRAP